MSFKVIIKVIMKMLYLIKCDDVYSGRHVVEFQTDLPLSSHVLMKRERSL